MSDICLNVARVLNFKSYVLILHVTKCKGRSRIQDLGRSDLGRSELLGGNVRYITTVDPFMIAGDKFCTYFERNQCSKKATNCLLLRQNIRHCLRIKNLMNVSGC